MEFWRGDKYITVDVASDVRTREQRHARRVWLWYYVSTEEFDRTLRGCWFRGEVDGVWIPVEMGESVHNAAAALEKARRQLIGVPNEIVDAERSAIERMKHADRKRELAALDMQHDDHMRDAMRYALDAMRYALDVGVFVPPRFSPKWGRNPSGGPDRSCLLNYLPPPEPVTFPHGDSRPRWAPWMPNPDARVRCTIGLDPASPPSPWQGPDQTCLLTKMANAREAARKPAPCARRFAFDIETAPAPKPVTPAARYQYVPSQAQADFLFRPTFVRELSPTFGHRWETPPVIERLKADRDAARHSRDGYCAQRDALRIEVLELQRKLDASEATVAELVRERETLHRKCDACAANAEEQHRGRRASDAEIERLRGEMVRVHAVINQGQAREKDLASKLAQQNERNGNQAEEIVRLRVQLAASRGRVLW